MNWLKGLKLILKGKGERRNMKNEFAGAIEPKSFEEDIESRIGDRRWWCCTEIGKRAATVPNRPLRWRASTAYEIQDSESMGGGEIRLWSYLTGIRNAIARSCVAFGMNPLDVNFRHFRHKEEDWYQVEIEDVILLTQDYCEYFGMFYWLVASCPYCKQQVKGTKMITNLYELGMAIKNFEPCKDHFEKCPVRDAACNRPGFVSDFGAEASARA